MNAIRRNLHRIILVSAISLSVGLPTISAHAASAEDLNQDSVQALKLLYRSHPESEQLARSSKAVLVFPKVIKAGLVFGGSYGEGVMTRADKVTGYYNSVSASWGLQVGAESFGYAIFLMNDSALQYLETSHGWELGAGPSLVFVNEGVAKSLSTSTIKDDAYVFIFDQQGLMLSLTIEGTKISPIHRK